MHIEKDHRPSRNPSPSTTARPSLEDAQNMSKSKKHPSAKQDATADDKDSEAQNADPVAKFAGAQLSPPPPNGGYGWVCVVCCGLINGHTWGINSSYGVFLAYYLANSVFPGATNLDYALVGGLSIAAAMLVSPLATYMTGLYGTRTTLLVGVVLQTVSLVTASFAGATWQLFLTQGACFGFGMGFLCK